MLLTCRAAGQIAGKNSQRMLRPKESCANHRLRRGLAVTELAVCLPVLTLIVIATIESCALIFLQQSLSVAAYEGARVALVPGAESANVRYQCELILADREVNDATISVTPNDFSRSLPGEWIDVQASAPFAANSMVGGWLFNGRTLTGRTQMMKEN